jgi:hypothetical protein
MRHRMKLLCLVLLLTAPARADITPPPDQGPAAASAGGLDFAMQSRQERMPPGYYKTFPVVVLVGCTEGTSNCTLAHAKNLIGMVVDSVDGDYLQAEIGRIKQIVDAFESQSGAKTVKLELYSRDSPGPSIWVSFAKQ